MKLDTPKPTRRARLCRVCKNEFTANGSVYTDPTLGPVAACGSEGSRCGNILQNAIIAAARNGRGLDEQLDKLPAAVRERDGKPHTSSQLLSAFKEETIG